MQISNATEYAIRAMLHLAANEGNGVLQISTISKAWNIPESFFRKVINNLTRTGLAFSSRGVHGGIMLAKPADQITLLDIIEATEGKIYLNKCLINSDMCDNIPWCSVHSVWGKVQKAFNDILKSKTLKELVSEPEFKTHYAYKVFKGKVILGETPS